MFNKQAKIIYIYQTRLTLNTEGNNLDQREDIKEVIEGKQMKLYSLKHKIG